MCLFIRKQCDNESVTNSDKVEMWTYFITAGKKCMRQNFHSHGGAKAHKTTT